MSAEKDARADRLSVTAFSLSLFVFPAFACWAMTRALGIPHGRCDAETRVSMLLIGTISSAVGLWSGYLGVIGLVAVLPLGGRKVDSASFLTLGPLFALLTVAASAYGAWVLRADLLKSPHALFYGPPALLILAASAGSMTYAAWSDSSERRHLGAVSFALDTPACAPGAEVRARLKFGKRPAAVSAVLELYLGKDDRPKKTVAASVADPETFPGGFLYRVTAVMPDQPRPKDDEGGWVLSVKAKGVGGGTFQDFAAVELRRA